MKFSIIVLLLLAVFMAVTNPTQKQHEQGIQDHVASDNALSGLLGVGFLSSKAVNYKDMVVLSTTEYDGSTVSIGAFSKIWIMQDNKLTR